MTASFSSPRLVRVCAQSALVALVCLSMLQSGFGVGFAQTKTFAVGSSPLAIASADFNGDGKVDVVVANSASMQTALCCQSE